LVRRSEAEASGNAPIELPRSTSVKLSSEPPRARRVISRGSVQKKVRISTKGTANLQFQNFLEVLRTCGAVASPAGEAERADFATICHALRGRKRMFGLDWKFVVLIQ